MAQAVTCDRCLCPVAPRRVTCVEVRGSDCGPRLLFRDLCPDCAREHEAWLNTPPVASGHPAPVVAGPPIVTEGPPTRPAWLDSLPAISTGSAVPSEF